MNGIARLWNSTKELHERFGVYPPLTIRVIRVFLEETREVVQAALLEDGDSLACEIADNIVTALALGIARGVALEQIEAAIERVAAKNDAKTHETHQLNAAGKIARKAS